MWAGRVGLVLVVLLLGGCDGVRRFVTKPDPAPLSCSAECFKPCTPLVPLPRWTSGSADELRSILVLDAQICGLPVNGVPSLNDAIHQDCEARRAACASCLGNLKANGVIR